MPPVPKRPPKAKPIAAAPPPAAEVPVLQCADINEAGYSIGRKLGEGRFSEVVLGTKVATGEEFAVKVVDQAALEEDEEALAALHTEVAVLKRASSHAHVVALHAVIRTPATTYLVMELLRGGELFDAIIARGSFPEAEARALLRQLLSALAYCHRLGVVHRDLKPENVLFESAEAADSGEGSLKLIDFGYAALHRPGERLRGLSGTPDYVAPEVLSWYEGDAADEHAPPPDGVEYDASCDLWSVGVVLYILLCGFPPFYAEGEADLIAKVRAGRYEFTSPYWDDISGGAKDLITRCLSLRPKDRPTAQQALKHPWMAEGGSTSAVEPAAPEPAPAAVAQQQQQQQQQQRRRRRAEPDAEAAPDVAQGAAPSPAAQSRAHAATVPTDDEATPLAPTPEATKNSTKGKGRAAPVATAGAVRAQPLAESPTNIPRPAPSAPDAAAAPPADRRASGQAGGEQGAGQGELIARIRQMRRAYAPGPPEGLMVHAGARATLGGSGAGGGAGGGGGGVPLQLTLEADGPRVAAAPSKGQLQQQGATFVRVPRDLFHDIYALVDAQRRGELPDSGEQPFAEVLHALSAEVQRGQLGTPAFGTT